MNEINSRLKVKLISVLLGSVIALLGSRLKWKLISIRLEIVLILTQDRCMVWAESSIGLPD
jgi:hypothetical protein